MDNIESVALELHKAKQWEKTAKNARIAIEEKLAAMVPTAENGSKTVEAGDQMKVTVKRAVILKADVKKLSEFCAEKGIEEVPLKTTTKTELDVGGYEWYREHKPELFKQMAAFVEMVPRKVSVTLKLA